MKYTRNNLKKLEELCSQLDYKVRYEQGHFQSGYCIVASAKVIVVNKFFDLEGRMNCLLDLLPELPVDLEAVSEEVRSFYHKAITLRTMQDQEA